MARLEIEPLDGKYYRSNATVVFDDGTRVDIEASTADYGQPSEREEFLREHPEEICDGHYERDATYKALLALKEALEQT